MSTPKTSPEPADFTHIRDWVFDLDNTLYPHHINLFAQIDRNMTTYVADLLQMEPDEARVLQKRYYHEHGTTLAGLMAHHGVDPNDFLEKAHAIDYSALLPDTALGEAIKALPGRKFIFTNGTVEHAEAAARALGILDHFDDIFDIVAAAYLPKPASQTYDTFTRLKQIDTGQAAMFEDLPRNLVVPKALGMKTVLLVPRNLETVVLESWERMDSDEGHAHVDYATDDLACFLGSLLAGSE
ncbi:pyrimidine 5'-nucleotidase [Agrobacterium vitis]|uniref:Pyrimidine 5'-nucleotidase n=1 Tax=Agrobacterium vitis TaxID=373 RepID=A0ABD6G5N3_AGRVI|nr:pyrimidine 5'-nucleotidase [Agrobacterium vitis]MUO79915.1 pyrimidine 5'-nucleotidase [Agrobacterium vitis]MUO93596.1 pyrimidine 5'-nucleotidase [Agrobacterium vitis]MUP04153.1 pyrimidine 5'-nucleotidase [Agrobacterium vitis]MUZ84363.1 pyrimidine 5'-nucleotidase [Agrobacterium vitis]MVA11076.1 pyrimidine 5'-nucleotidase [Agrobacterium vitis]